MATLRSQIALLDDAELDQAHAAALDLAGTVGLEVRHDGLLGRLAGQDGVEIRGQRVHFRADRIEAALAAMQYPPGPDEFSIISGAYIIAAQDAHTGEIRSSTERDLVDLLKLGQGLGLCGSPPVRPLDLPEPLQEAAMYKAAWTYTEHRPEPLFDTTPMSTVASAELIYEMAQSIGKPFSVGMYLISPFTCPVEGLDVIAAFLDRQVPMWVGSMPMAGLTSPIFMVGAHVQALAELMAGITLLHELSPDVPIFWTPIDSVRAHPFDMRHATFVYSSPEDMLGSVIQAQLNRRYGVPQVAKSLLSTAREPDEQIAAEKATHTLLAALAGARYFTNGGFVSVDDYVSPAQIVIDHEIVQHVKHVINGIPTDAQAQAADVIREVATGGGSFLEHESTLLNVRATYDPALFTHLPYKTPAGRVPVPPLWERATGIAQQKIAEAEPVLPEADRRTLDAIYTRAAGRLRV